MFSVEIRVNTELVCYAYGRRLLQSPLDPEAKRGYRVEFYKPENGHTYTVELEHRPADGLIALVHAAMGKLLECGGFTKPPRSSSVNKRLAVQKAVAQTESKRTGNKRGK